MEPVGYFSNASLVEGKKQTFIMIQMCHETVYRQGGRKWNVGKGEKCNYSLIVIIWQLKETVCISLVLKYRISRWQYFTIVCTSNHTQYILLRV